MVDILKKHRKMILVTLIGLIAAINVCVILIANFSDYLKQSAAEIVGSTEVDKVSFCADSDFFDNAPPFTVESVSAAYESRFDYFLTDAYTTKDGLLVCSPSDDLKNVLGIDGSIKDHTYYDLLNYNLLSKSKDKSYPLMLCSDFINHCIGLSLTPVIFPHGLNSLKPIENILKAYEHSDSVVFMSDDFELLRNISENYPEIKLWYKVDEADDEAIDNLTLLPNAQIIFNAKNKTNNAEIIEKIKQRDISFGCYNVNSRSVLKKYISLGASEIITSKYVKTK